VADLGKLVDLFLLLFGFECNSKLQTAIFSLHTRWHLCLIILGWLLFLSIGHFMCII
jgi:hypothetical protein